MGFVDSFLNIMRLNPDDDEYDDYDDDDYLDEEEEEVEKHSFFGRRKAKQAEEDDYDSDEDVKTESRREKRAAAKERERQAREEEKASARNNSKVVQMRQNRRQVKEEMEVCIIRPTTIEDAREITQTLLKGCTLLLDMEGVNVDIAQRIIDFSSGATFAIDGNLQKINGTIFLLTPPGVEVSGDVGDIQALLSSVATGSSSFAKTDI